MESEKRNEGNREKSSDMVPSAGDSPSLLQTVYLQQETGRYHHTYDEELLQYEYIRDGDMRSIEESKRMFRSGITGTLAKNPLTNIKYLFVASVTLTTRFCIEGGLDMQIAYNISDLYIQRMDSCTTVEQVMELQTIMVTDFTRRMSRLDSPRRPGRIDPESRAVSECKDYIYYHLHEPIRIPDIAGETGLSPNYLSALFHRECGQTIQQYIEMKRIEMARNMLLYSHSTLTEIGSALAFSSTSYFIKVFRKHEGMTPAAYREKYYRSHSKWA